MFFAHSTPGPKVEWEKLDCHLREVANRAAGFADAFGARDWGKIAGLWHDLGKYSAQFQSYICRPDGAEASAESVHRSMRVDHSTSGARHAASAFPGAFGRILAYCIAGHHVGLPNDGTPDDPSSLQHRLGPDYPIPDHSAAPQGILQPPRLDAPREGLSPGQGGPEFTLSVFCRMLFSSLVDADFLATEAFLSPHKSAERGAQPAQAAPTTPAGMLSLLDKHIETLAGRANASGVNRERASVLRQCREKAIEPPGLFSLTVPTGGGKTLSSLAFALTHAARHNLRRVIYAIPFTSIIEQNADVFRKALAAAGQHALIEHHSNLDADDPERETRWGRLASENWDAPLIVTTNVQLFESLFASRTSACRKLHNMVRSVIVLDECQNLPVELLTPTLAMLDELRRNYGCTIVFCSATQPAITKREGFPIGLTDVREIIDRPRELSARLKRVTVEQAGKLDDPKLAELLAAEPRVLAIVNTRPHAARLFELLRQSSDPDGTFHLSASMCAAHRTDRLAEIRARLKSGNPCRVISTTLVEAGVDLDFPAVYRAMAGLDSITQAAGRCNREGELPSGRVVIFATDAPPPPYARPGADITRELAGLYKHDLLGLEAIDHYFRLHYWSKKDRWDAEDIMGCFRTKRVDGRQLPYFQFRQAAERYRLIADAQTAVLVPYGDTGRALIRQLTALPESPGRDLIRRLQRYAVNVFPHQLSNLQRDQVIALLHERYWVLMNEAAYDNQLGLVGAAGWSPGELLIG